MTTYEVAHRTVYGYDHEVTSSYGRAYLLPRDAPGQTCHGGRITAEPGADVLAERADFYGNRAAYLEVRTPHRELVVECRSLIEVTRQPADLATLGTRAWDTPAPPAGWADLDFALPSPLVPLTARVRRVAAGIFRPGRPLAEAVPALVHHIHSTYRYTPGSTGVTSTIDDLLDRGEGVCQDFAHLAVACLRAAGLPARYVSGYLETTPPPGQPKLQGVDASHAWASVLLPGLGWVDLDPTNDRLVDATYIVTAWGRDYADVPPLKGVIFSTSTSSTLTVAVDVRALTR
ncbi:transglutaminase family protein [Dactylosporangium sp. NPDC005572]|uniref:transglutaminase family protein n=1 Tax=Dactylosporangium sp. NPDC005572 TaxID=3156889 RepID=UPI0033B9A1F8